MTNKDLRVVQFSFDVLVDKDFDSYMLVKAMEDMGVKIGGRDIDIVGADFSDDVSSYYNIKELVNDWGCKPQKFIV